MINIRRKAILLIMCLSMFLLAGCSGEAVETMVDEGAGLADAIELQYGQEATLAGPYLVERVVDGDTLVLNIEGTQEKVRLIGVNTPESVHPDENRNVAYGKIASAYTKGILTGQEVYLELDVQERDKYGRILGYVYYNGEMFNQRLVLDGHAEVATYPPNVKYVEVFTEAQKQARVDKNGMWGYIEGEAGNGKEIVTGALVGSAAEGSSYVGNSSSMKYHKSSCGSVDDMNTENKVGFDTKKQAESAGYEACGRCKP